MQKWSNCTKASELNKFKINLLKAELDIEYCWRQIFCYSLVIQTSFCKNIEKFK